MNHECPSNFNPADFFIHTLAIIPGSEEESRQWVTQICDAFGDTEGRTLSNVVGSSDDEVTTAPSGNLADTSQNYTEKTSIYKASWVSQFRTVLSRSWTANLREPIIIRFRIVQTLVRTFKMNLAPKTKYEACSHYCLLMFFHPSQSKVNDL